jgi:hypothetical protein
MLTSIEGIARAASAAARRPKDAVSVVETTNHTVHQLGQSSAQIGSVAKLIATITAQTDVLALNAMIEAARAGHGTATRSRHSGTSSRSSFGSTRSDVPRQSATTGLPTSRKRLSSSTS